ncbi:hypothetical protein Cni_G14341 [Canna indica]|uniref:GATA transcription factor n=1 Tax=Canna indica TaxID=4628 RepID=A0AAQ3KG82_9LILI|nr:hypothetical protein Cni_G14341 [Canna indica]
MGKVGPCRHCGVTSTPLWRNGPPEKPVLCNACGSRWRTKGSLTNYTPMHARDAQNTKELTTSKTKSLSFKATEEKLQKPKQSSNGLELENEMQYCDQNFQKFKGDMNNRSSSGSAISNSETCAVIGTTNANDMTGSSQSNVWESVVPSKKRTFLSRPKTSPVEKLTKDLFSIFHEQQSSNISGVSEEDLIYESETPLGSTEIGCGVLLIRHPNSMSVEEESEASSLSLDKYMNGSYMELAYSPVDFERKGTNNGIDKLNNLTTPVAKENARRDKSSPEKLKILLDRDSSIGSIDLTDLVNFEGFMKYLTFEEQQWLMNYLPSVDTRLPQSLRNMFKSSKFMETFSFFRQLLQEGIFDLSFSGATVEDCRTLKRFVLQDMEKSKWVEYYKKIKGRVGKGKEIEAIVPGIYNITSMKRAYDSCFRDSSETDGPMKSPKRVCKLGLSILPLDCSPQHKSGDTVSKLTKKKDGFAEDEGKFFGQRSLLLSTSDMCSMLVPSQFTADSSDHDLLLDVPCNASFPEAELLCHHWKEKTILNGSPGESAAEIEESFSSFQSPNISNKLTVHR